MRLSSNSAAPTSLLRHLAIAMIGMATLGGCAYGPPGGGGYYGAPSAIYAAPSAPGGFYGYPASFGAGGIWIGGGRDPGTMVGTMAGTTGTATTVITGIGMTAEGAEGTGTVPRAEGIQEAMAASLRSGTDRGPALRGRWSERVRRRRYSACVSQNAPSVSRALNMAIRRIYTTSQIVIREQAWKRILPFYHIDGDLQDRLTCAVHPSIGPRKTGSRNNERLATKR